MAQPNLAVIAESLQTHSDQGALVPYTPGHGALQQNVTNLDQRVGALEQCVGALDRRVDDLDRRVGDLDRQVTNNHQVLLETINTNQRLMVEQMQNIHTQMQQNHLSLSRQLTQLQDEVVLVHLTEGIRKQSTRQNLQPLRLYNSGLSETDPLRYPPPRYSISTPPLPFSRLDLSGMPCK